MHSVPVQVESTKTIKYSGEIAMMRKQHDLIINIITKKISSWLFCLSAKGSARSNSGYSHVYILGVTQTI